MSGAIDATNNKTRSSSSLNTLLLLAYLMYKERSVPLEFDRKHGKILLEILTAAVAKYARKF